MEQFTYGPFSIVSFYFGMNILEGKSVEDAWLEVKHKFLQTWKVKFFREARVIKFFSHYLLFK